MGNDDYKNLFRRQDNGNQRRKASNRPSGRRRSSRQESQRLVITIVIIFVSAIIFIGIGVAAYRFVVNDNNGNQPNNSSSTPGVTETEATPSPSPLAQEVTNLTGLIKSINLRAKELTLYNLSSDSGESYSLKIEEGAAAYTKKTGVSASLSELSPGDIVDVELNSEDMSIRTLKESAEAWEKKSITSARIDQLEKLITIGNQHYKYNDELIVTYKGSTWSIDKIDQIDQLTVRGLNENAWFVEVNKSHGFITMSDLELVKDISLEVDSEIYVTPDGVESISIQEGTHNVSVKGSNIESFTKVVTVNQGETITLDLTDVQIKTGILNVKVNEAGCKIFIDDEEMPTSEAIALEYGEYTLRVEKENFRPFEDTITINQALEEISVEIEQEIKLGNVSVTTFPEGADVYIDSGYAGTSPVSVSIEYGAHTLLVIKEGYISVSMQIDVKEANQPYLITLSRDEAATTPQPTQPPISTQSPAAPPTPPASTEVPDTNTNTAVPPTIDTGENSLNISR